LKGGRGLLWAYLSWQGAGIKGVKPKIDVIEARVSPSRKEEVTVVNHKQKNQKGRVGKRGLGRRGSFRNERMGRASVKRKLFTRWLKPSWDDQRF